MATKELAVDGLTLSPQGIVTPGTGTLTITSTPSTKVKPEGKGVYTASLQFTLVGANATGYDPGTVQIVGTAAIAATAVKVKADGSFVMRVDDQNAAVSMTGTISGTPTPFVEPWKITNAGQTKVKGN
jgi:hypothetical protein